MTISSIHFQKADVEFAKKHNFRTEKKEPEYLLDTQYRKTNEYLDLHDPKELYQEQMELRKQNHCRGYAPQIKDVYWEAVVNLDEKHSLADVRKVADFIQQNYHIQTCSIALHHDEGYKDKDGTVKYNHHAHLCFLTMDNGISTMRKIRSKELRQMQTDVAQLLGLERGKENSKATRLDHKQYREKAKELERAELKHNQELAEVEQKQKQAEAVLQLVNPTLQRSIEEKKQLNSTAKRLQNKVLTLKAQKAIVGAEREKTAYWKSLYDQAPVKTRKDLDDLKSKIRKEMISEGGFTAQDYRALSKFIKDYKTAFKLGEAITVPEVINNIYQRLNKPKEVVKEVIKTVPQQLTDSDIEKLPRVKELKKQNTELTQQRDNLLKFNSTVLQVIQAMYSDFDLEHPIQSLKKIYTDWKIQQQKSSITAPKRSITNENTVKRTEVQQNTTFQPMSVLEQKTTEKKKYRIMFGADECFMTAQDIRDWLTDYPEERDIIAKQLSEEDRAEVFGEPQQKQSLFSRVKHSLER